MRSQKVKNYNIAAGRTREQIAKMRKLQKLQICAFCPEHFATYHDNPVEFETAHWIVSKNDYPYKGTSLHLLIVSKLHTKSIKELPDAAKADLMQTVAEIEKRFSLTSFSLGMRVGDFNYNGGSVTHLHAHILVSDFKSPDKHEPVYMKLTSVPHES